MLTEAEGCAILKGVFVAHGFAIAENVPFHEDGLSFNIDGWDAKARVGYEYLTREAGDYGELPPVAVAALETRMEAGHLYVLLIDETDVGTAAELARSAERFLERVAVLRGDRA